MPRSADPAVRAALVAAAAHLLATEGPHALTTRRLATAVGASTMAVYTHFGSMDELHQAVRSEGFGRLGAAIDAAGRTDDPVADLAAAVAAYVTHGSAEPELYRAMYAGRPPGHADAGTEVFARLRAAVARCADTGRFELAEPPLVDRATAEFWITGHGAVTLSLSGTLPTDQLDHLLVDMTYRLAIGHGDDPATARRSVGR